MTGASLRYLIKEGFRNTWTNRMMSIASICVLMSCLVLIGSAFMIFLIWTPCFPALRRRT